MATLIYRPSSDITVPSAISATPLWEKLDEVDADDSSTEFSHQLSPSGFLNTQYGSYTIRLTPTETLPRNAQVNSVTCYLRSYRSTSQSSNHTRKMSATLTTNDGTSFTGIASYTYSASSYTTKSETTTPTLTGIPSYFNMQVDYSDQYTDTGTAKSTTFYFTQAYIVVDYTITIVDTIYLKQNNSWVTADEVWVKTSSGWVKQTDITNVFNTSTKYIHGNSS